MSAEKHLLLLSQGHRGRLLSERNLLGLGEIWTSCRLMSSQTQGSDPAARKVDWHAATGLSLSVCNETLLGKSWAGLRLAGCVEGGPG